MRYAVNSIVPSMQGILLINVIGCYLLGLIMYDPIYLGRFDQNIRLLIGVGIIGAFTTFSTFSYQTFTAPFQAATANVLLNLILGLAAVFLARSTIIWVSGR